MRTLVLIAAIVTAGLLASAGQRPPTTEAAGPGTWTQTASMATARGGHQATVLLNGRVLVTGGYNGAATSSVEIFDPAVGVWSSRAPLSVARYNHTATLLPSGNVLVVGGQATNGSWINSPEIYNIVTNTWASAGTMAEARFSHTATLLPNGNVLVAGGYGMNGAEIYEPGANSWTVVSSMNEQRRLHSAALLANGKVLVAGGVGCLPCIATAGAELYDPVGNTWTETGPLATPRYQHASSLLATGKVLVAGGWQGGVTTNTAELFDPTSNTWAATSNIGTGRVSAMDVFLGNGRLLVAGGGTTDAASDIATSEYFDAVTGSWSSSGAMTMPRNNGAASLLRDGRVLATGGGTVVDGYTNTAELYDPMEWRSVAPPPVPNNTRTPGLLWNGNVLFFDENYPQTYNPVLDTWTDTTNGYAPFDSLDGVVLKTGNALTFDGTTTQVYHRVSNTWSPGPPLLGPDMSHIPALLNNGRVLITSPGGIAEVYDPGTNTTALTGSFNPDNFSSLVTLVDGRVLAPGGYNTDGDSSSAASLYDPMTNAWSPAASMSETRGSAAIVRLGDGRVLVSGGEYQRISSPPLDHYSLPSAEIYSPITNTWTTVPNMIHPRSGHALVLLPDNRVLAMGGCDYAPLPSMLCNQVQEAEIFSPSTNTWTSAGLMPQAHASPSAILQTDGNVLAVGGGYSSSDLFDTGIGTDTDGDGYNDGLELALGQHPWSFCKTMRGDLTGDGLVNSGDQGKLASKFGVRPPPQRFDQNGDKQINSGDQGLMASKFNQSVLMCP